VRLRKRQTLEAVIEIEAPSEEGAIDRAWLARPDFFLKDEDCEEEAVELLGLGEPQS
jgi:hypothetical protein